MTAETLELIKWVATTWGGPGVVILFLGYWIWSDRGKLETERAAHLETIKTALPALNSNTTSNLEAAKALEKVSSALRGVEDNVHELLVRDGVAPRRRSKTEA